MSMDPNMIMSSAGDADESKATQGGDEFEEIREQVRQILSKIY